MGLVYAKSARHYCRLLDAREKLKIIAKVCPLTNILRKIVTGLGESGALPIIQRGLPPPPPTPPPAAIRSAERKLKKALKLFQELKVEVEQTCTFTL